MRRDAGKEILITGMCIRVWLKQTLSSLIFLSGRADRCGGGFGERRAEKQTERGGMRWNKETNEGGGGDAGREKRWRCGEMWRDRHVSRGAM